MTRLLSLLACLLGLTAITAFAQGGPEPVDPTTSPFEWYTSVGGVGVATLFVVQLIKRVLGNVDGLQAVPIWVYAVVTSGILTFFCVKVLGTLPGNVWQLAWQAIYNAAIATGIYEWVGHANTPMKASVMARRHDQG